MRMLRNLITVHAVSKFKMCLLFSFSEILVDGRHAKLVAESVADLSRCVKKWVTVKQVCATSYLQGVSKNSLQLGNIRYMSERGKFAKTFS